MKLLIKLEEEKDVFIVNNVYEFLNPENVYIPLNNLSLKEKNYFYKDSYLNDFIVSVSGSLAGIEEMLINGKKMKTIKVNNDFKEIKEFRKVKPKIKTIQDLIQVLELNHLDAIKEKIMALPQIDHLIVSSFDEEIYEMNEFMCLGGNYKEILKLIDDLKKLFSLDSSILAIKNTNAKGIKKVKSISGIYPDLKVMLLPDKYLMSYPINLGDYLNIPLDNTLILTTNEIYEINEILKGKSISEKYVTISGNALKKSLIIKTKIGVSLKEIIHNFIKITTSDYVVYENGLLQGSKINEVDKVVITHNTRCIVINKKEEKEETPCINCGACMKICPVNINVKKCYEQNLMSHRCLGCGLCDYICPANLSLKAKVKGGNYEETNN